MTRIVFSKDRALQLHAFLRSYQDHVSPQARMTVLYKATSLRHHAAYEEVFRLFPWVRPFAQASFKEDLLELLPTDGLCILFADDHLFVRHWVEEEQPINLHLGLNLTHCYTKNVSQPIPKHTLIEPDKVTWRWGAGLLDWGYPMSPCGQVLEADQLRRMIACIACHSPNSLEVALQAFAPAFWDRMGVCYRESKLVLLPWNRVQDECPNRYGAQFPSADELVCEWESGHQINISSLYGVQNVSVHQELPMVLESR